MKNRSTLIHQNPIMFTPDLACLIGINCAIVMQKLEFLLNMPDSGSTINGERYIYNTSREWREKYFPFWSEETIEKIFCKLEAQGFIKSVQPEAINRRKHYRITEHGIELLTTGNLGQQFISDDEQITEKNEDNHGDLLFANNDDFPKRQVDALPKRKINALESVDSPPCISTKNTITKNTNVILLARARESEKVQPEMESNKARMNSIWNRRVKTKWTPKEETALRSTLGTQEEEWSLLERYYALRGTDGVFCRNSMITMLNYFPGEIDKAKRYFAEAEKKSKAKSEESEGW